LQLRVVIGIQEAPKSYIQSKGSACTGPSVADRLDSLLEALPIQAHGGGITRFRNTYYQFDEDCRRPKVFNNAPAFAWAGSSAAILRE
jgi:hypothetical protein